MAIQTSDLLLKLNPVGSLGGGQESSMERQRLKLMREQFENQKKQQEKANELAKLEESGRMARAQLDYQGQMSQLDAQQAAATKKSKMEAYQKFTELNGSGDIEGARAMVPLMSALGMGVDLEGEEGGLPRYRIEMDADEAEKRDAANEAQTASYGKNETAEQSLSRLDGMGLENESGTLDAPVGVSSSDQVDDSGLSVAERVASTYGEPGEKTPMAPPGEADYTGGVPKNVIDTGAIASQTAARLNPALSGIIGGMPAEYQDSARSTASGLAGTGLGTEKSLALFGKQQGDANALITGGLNREQDEEKMRRDAAKEAYASRTGSDKEGFDRYDVGFSKIAKEIGEQYNAKGRKQTRSLNQQAMGILTNKTKEDDYLVLSLISRSFGERGATTEGDVARALGLPATSTWDQIVGWMSTRLDGGIPEPNKKALVGVLKKAIDANDGELKTYSTSLLELADDPETDPDVRRGVLDYWRATVPADLRGDRKKQPQGARGNSSAGMVTGEVVIPDSARIAKVHNNPGNLKFVGQEGATEGEAADDGGTWAKFESPEAGLQALRSQIELDASRGQTVREFVTKYAPPGSNDTERYIEQAAASLRAKPDDKLDELDTYDILRFMAQKESGTVIPDQYDQPAEEAMAEQTAAEPAAAAPPDDAEAKRARLLELRKKYGR